MAAMPHSRSTDAFDTTFSTLASTFQSATSLQPTALANAPLGDTTLARLRGSQWQDINRNGLRDANEPGLADRTVYLDQNRNGRLDAGEQFTTTDSNGNYDFTNLAPGTYTVAVVLPSGWSQTAQTSVQSTLIPVVNRRDLIVDPMRDRLYVTTSDGKIERYDITSRTLLMPWQVGNALNGGDITPDGSSLYVAENQPGATQRFFRKVNLTTGDVTNLTFAPEPFVFDGSPSDIAITANGLGIFRGFGQWQYTGQIDLSNDTISPRKDSGLIFGGAQIVRSGDRSLFFTTQDGISSGPLQTYDAGTNTFSEDRNTSSYLGNNIAAVNRNGSLIALEWDNGISILDRNLNVVENLSGVDGGLTFDPVQDILYAANSSTDQLIAFDTNTWQELYRLNIGEDIASNQSFDNSSRPLGNGVMAVSNGGYLFMSTSSGVRMMNLLPPGVQVVNLLEGQDVINIDFGSQALAPPLSAIAGLHWNDINGNGTKEFNEPGLAGWTVYLDQNQNTQLDVGELSTLTDTNGNYTFTGLAAGTYTVALVPQAGWNQTLPLSSQSTLIPVSDRRDLIVDGGRNQLYLTTSSGTVERYDMTTGTLLTPWKVGNSLNGGDITPDGSALYIAENQQGATQGIVRKVNLTTGAVTNLTTPDASWDTLPSDVAIASNGIGLVRRRGQWQQMLELNLSTDVITPRSISGLLYGGDLIARSGDRSLLLIRGADGLFTYNAVTNSFSPQRPANANSLFAVNRDGSLIAVEVGTSISILDRNLNSVENLTNVDGGLAFDPIRDILYAASAATDQIIAFDTNTWQELYRFNVGEDLRGNSSFDDPSKPLGNGVMTVSNDGRYLFLSTIMGVRMFNLGATAGNTRSHTISLPTGKTVTGISFAAQQIPAFSISDVTLTEGDNGVTNAVFTVTLNRSVTQAITVDYTTSDATAVAGQDYTATSGTLTFTPGQTSKTITVSVIGDSLDEPNEVFNLLLSNPTSGIELADATAIATIMDNDPKFSISDAQIIEGNDGIRTAEFTVSLSNVPTEAVTVNYATANGSAIAGLDYTATNGMLTFTPGETSKTISVDILGDAQFEVNETVFVNLSSPEGAGLLDSRGVGTIVNDDPAPSVLAITDATVIEGNDSNFAAFTVVLSTATPQPVTVNYATSNGTAIAGSDYITTSGTLTFAPNETLKVILVPIVGDMVSEPDEAFFVNLSNSSNAIIGDISGFGIIRNDDVA
jgi:hypothetical protein